MCSEASSLVECKNITKKYGNKVALYDFSISIGRGRIIGLLGSNGSGKTTFIKLLAGLLTPMYGEITIDGKPIGIETKKIISYLPERTYLNPDFTVKETISLFSDFYKDFSVETAEKMVSDLGINPKNRIRSMSKGMREKIQLILVMSRQAELYLLDEPMGGIDPAARDFIIKTIISNYNENSTVIISTHLISDIENLLDEAIFIKNGELYLHKEIDEIREEYGKSVDELFREVYKC
ncbi:MAG: ABC transporter ATP-binding protein [Oscillospiraceae bacterium]